MTEHICRVRITAAGITMEIDSKTTKNKYQIWAAVGKERLWVSELERAAKFEDFRTLAAEKVDGTFHTSTCVMLLSFAETRVYLVFAQNTIETDCIT